MILLANPGVSVASHFSQVVELLVKDYLKKQTGEGAFEESSHYGPLAYLHNTHTHEHVHV